MAVPNQPCGLTSFDKRLISKCPPNPNAIRSVVFLRDNLSVVNGANTEIQIPLKDLYIPVKDAAQVKFSIAAKNNNLPYTIHKLDLSIVGNGEGAKFLGILPQYGTASNTNLSVQCGGTPVTSSSEFVEWAFAKDIENGELFNQSPVGPVNIVGSQGNPYTSFYTNQVNKLEFSWGGFLSDTLNFGNLWAGTNGGLLKWDSKEMKLWNTLNSDSPSDLISTIVVDSNNSLWIGSNNGISRFTESQGFFKKYNIENSEILSNNIKSLKLYSANNLVIGTSEGLSLLNISNETWKNYSIYNTPNLTNNNINKLALDSNYIFAGTPDGVFTYNFLTDSWSATIFDNTIPGWNAPNDVQSLEARNGFLYVGTTGGLVIVPYMGGTASTIVAGPSGPSSDDFISLRIVDFYGDVRLYAGHSSSISVYSITNDDWFLTGAFLSSGVNDILPDFLSGNSSVDTIFLGSENEGIGKLVYTSTTSDFSRVPESNKVGSLLLSYPPPVNTGKLYSSNQPFYFIFSKPFSNNLPNYTSIKEGLNGSGDLISGSWTFDADQTLAIFISDSPLQKAAPYNIKIENGVVMGDGSYLKDKLNTNFYTEDIVPVLGWNVLGKMLIHTGAEGKYTESIYLRNPQNFGVNFTALIGK